MRKNSGEVFAEADNMVVKEGQLTRFQEATPGQYFGPSVRILRSQTVLIGNCEAIPATALSYKSGQSAASELVGSAID